MRQHPTPFAPCLYNCSYPSSNSGLFMNLLKMSKFIAKDRPFRSKQLMFLITHLQCVCNWTLLPFLSEECSFRTAQLHPGKHASSLSVSMTTYLPSSPLSTTHCWKSSLTVFPSNLQSQGSANHSPETLWFYK